MSATIEQQTQMYAEFEPFRTEYEKAVALAESVPLSERESQEIPDAVIQVHRLGFTSFLDISGIPFSWRKLLMHDPQYAAIERERVERVKVGMNRVENALVKQKKIGDENKEEYSTALSQAQPMKDACPETIRTFLFDLADHYDNIPNCSRLKKNATCLHGWYTQYCAQRDLSPVSIGAFAKRAVPILIGCGTTEILPTTNNQKSHRTKHFAFTGHDLRTALEKAGPFTRKRATKAAPFCKKAGLLCCATPRSSAPSAPAFSVGERLTLTSRLAELDEALAGELISGDEHRSMRERILADFLQTAPFFLTGV
jgi:hypothetical protein